MAVRKKYTVNYEYGLNVRESPSLSAPILRVLKDGDPVTIDNAVKTEEGWKALQDGGYVMFEYLK